MERMRRKEGQARVGKRRRRNAFGYDGVDNRSASLKK